MLKAFIHGVATGATIGAGIFQAASMADAMGTCLIIAIACLLALNFYDSVVKL